MRTLPRAASFLFSLVVIAAACGPSAAPTVSPRATVAQPTVTGALAQEMVFDFGSLWVPIGDLGVVARVDPATGVAKQIRVSDTSKIPSRVHFAHFAPSGIASGFGAIWATGADETVTRIDPNTEKVESFSIRAPGYQIAAGDDALWIASAEDGVVLRFDPREKRVTGTTTDVGSVYGITEAFGSAWAVNHSGHEVVRIDKKTGTISARIPTDQAGDFVAAGAGSVWVTCCGGVIRIDPATNAIIAKIPKDPRWGAGAGIAFAEGAIWAGFLVRIDPASNHVSATFAGPVGDEQTALTVGGGSAWIEVSDHVIRVPLVLVHD